MAEYRQLTSREMLAKGYSLAPNNHPDKPSTCNKCGQEIQWWISPNKKSIPYDPCFYDDRERTCHFATCPDNQGKTNQANGAYPATQIEAMKDIKRGIVAEYKHDHDGDANYMDPEHKCNWLYKKLAEARFALREKSCL